MARSNLGNEKGIVTFIQRASLNDGPGIRTTVFLKGCRMRCRWCHNPEGIRHYPEVFHYWPNCNDCGKCDDICPAGAMTVLEKAEFGGDRISRPDLLGTDEYVVELKKKTVRKIRINKDLCIGCLRCVEVCPSGAFVVMGTFVTVEEVLDEVESDVPFYKHGGGGMTISGGEPLAQPDFTYALLKGAKERGIHTALDTSGYVEWESLDKILDYTDLVLYDIKNMDAEVHKWFSGVSNELILENAKRIVQRGVEMRVRLPVIPDVNDSEKNMEETAKFVKSLEKVEWVDFLPYHPYAGQKYRLFSLEFPFPVGEGYPEEKLEKLTKIFESYGLKTTIGG